MAVDFSQSEVSVSDWSYYSNDAMRFAKILYDPTRKVYVRVDKLGSSREGTIAVAVPCGYSRERNDWITPDFSQQSSYYYSRNWNVYYVDLHHDDGRVTKGVSARNLELTWLTGYSGSTVWKFVRGAAKPKPPKIPSMDRLGHEISVGDLVVFTANHYRYSAGTLFFGTVRKISDKGIPTVEAFKTRENDSNREYRILQPDRVTKLTADILDDLMMRKLMY